MASAGLLDNRALLDTGALLSMSVTVLIVLFYLYSGFRVGSLRGKHHIAAPACTGHPEFERAYRVQMNTLEQMAIVLPLLWVATICPVQWPWTAPLIGAIWVAGRIVYMRGYMLDPQKRAAGAMIGGVCALLLLILAIAGLVVAWRAGRS